jgi:anti-sigma regulatory factor (Ser/Thr protein kinase)
MSTETKNRAPLMPAESRVLELHLDTDGLRIAAARREILRHLQSIGADDADYSAAELIVGELLANVSRHAPGHFDVLVGMDGGYAFVEVRDRGPGFTLPTSPRSLLEASGHGLHLVRTLARKLDVRHVPGEGTTVYAELPVPERRRS